jgi:O-antigen biosynthesis protein
VVPLFNCLPLTQAMVASLRATLPTRLTYEIILVDDGSSDGTREWLATLAPPFRVVLNEQNLGYAAANNRGAAIAIGENLALLNNDLVLTRGWLEPMLVVQRRLGTRAGLIGNVQRTVATGEIDHCGILINEKGKPEHDRSFPLWVRWLWPSPMRIVPAVTGACLVVNRELFLANGGFSEEYVNGCEDVDLAFRLAAQDRINAVALRSVVRHHVSASPGRKRRDELNTYRLTLRWRDALTRHGARQWSGYHLWREWTAPSSSAGFWLAAGLLAHSLHLRRHAPPAAIIGIRAAIDHELARWRGMFGDESTP